MIPIGGNFTTGPVDAAYAIKNWIKPKMVLPMHYNSNPMATGTFAQFAEAMKGSSVKVLQMTEGQTMAIPRE
jgi:L-ascorbate metabolism protein UlaG (beta-lactamase superfamily)